MREMARWRFSCSTDTPYNLRVLRRQCIIIVLGLSATGARADDDTLSWLLETHASTAPTTRPATAPAGARSPLLKPAAEVLLGKITLSSGEELAGQISSTAGKPLRVWVEAQHEYVDMPLSEVKEVRATVIWERDEAEWHFIASGSDVKEYTGKTYPARETTYTFVTSDGREIAGSVVAPIYVRTPDGERMLVLHKRDKGAIGQTLADLIFITRISFEPSGRKTP